jgi:hypothetical protein
MPARQGDTTVTEPQGSDQRLADAFRALNEPPGEALSDEDREQIWQAVSGVLPAEERRALVDRMARDPACAEAWRVAHEMWRASQDGVASAAGPEMGAARPRRWAASWLAAAAVLLVGTTIGLVSLREPGRGDEFRSTGGYVIESRLAADSALPREACTVRWQPGPAGSRYQVRVTTAELDAVVTAADLEVPQFTVPADRLSSVATGAIVLWQVDAFLPDGQRVTSRAFVTRVR